MVKLSNHHRETDFIHDIEKIRTPTPVREDRAAGIKWHKRESI